MITTSSNLATNLLLKLAGADAANDVLQKFGPAAAASSARSLRRACDGARPAQSDDCGRSRRSTDRLKTGRALGPANSQLLLDLLAANLWTEEIPAGLPPGVRVEHKNGWLAGARHDGGIAYPTDTEPFVLVVLTTGMPDDEAGQLIADLATLAWDERGRS
jgi:beta-lactamase class A